MTEPLTTHTPDLSAATVDAAGLAVMLHRCKKTVLRGVRREELPRPFRLLGKNVWLVSAIEEYLRQRQAAALASQKRDDAKRQQVLT